MIRRHKPRKTFKQFLTFTAVSIVFMICVFYIKISVIGLTPATESDSAFTKFALSGNVVERDYTAELENQIAEYKAEIEKIHNESQLLANTQAKEIIKSKFPSYDFSKLSAPKNIAQLIAIQCRLNGFNSMDEIYAIIAYESKFDAKCRALTPTEDSRGLLQVNTYTNYPKGWNKDKLYDAEYNLSYQLPELHDYYVLGQRKGLKGKDLACFISRYGQRPAWTNKNTRNYIISTISKFYDEVVNSKLVKAV